MPNETGIPDGEAWYIRDYFGTVTNRNVRTIVRVTKTQLVTKYGLRFRKPENLEDGTYLRKVGGNDFHVYKFFKIIKRKKVDPVKM